MEALGSDCGQNGIASQVLEFRKKVIQRLLDEANITCGRTDIINSGGSGYRLQEWITVEYGNPSSVPTGAGAAALEGAVFCDDSRTDSNHEPSNGLNERQSWAMSQLKKERQLQIRQVIDRFGCTSATAKRDLNSPKIAGLVRFVGSARAGHYQLRSEGTK